MISPKLSRQNGIPWNDRVKDDHVRPVSFKAVLGCLLDTKIKVPRTITPP
jgi:hypothetical protein